LRVAIVSYRPVGTMPTGSRRILLDLATGLVERGFRVAIYNISRRGVGCPEALDPGVECVEMDEDLLRRSLLLPTRILTAASREGLLFTKFLVQPWVDRVSRVYYEIAEDIASRGCDVAILETIYTGFLFPLLVYMGVPSAIRIHNVEAEYVSSIAYRRLRGVAYRVMNHVELGALKGVKSLIAISARDKLILERLYGVEAAYLGPTVRASRKQCSSGDADAVKRYGLECGSYIVFVGSSHKPNIEAIEHALHSIERSGVRATIAVAGSIGEYLAMRGVKNKGIKILGVVPEETLKSLYCCASASLAPIISGGGVPIKLIESLLYGLPTITSKRALLIVPGLKHGENVLIAEEVGGVGEAIKILAKDRGMAEDISRGAMKLSEETIGFEKTIERYIKYIRSIASAETS